MPYVQGSDSTQGRLRLEQDLLALKNSEIRPTSTPADSSAAGRDPAAGAAAEARQGASDGGAMKQTGGKSNHHAQNMEGTEETERTEEEETAEEEELPKGPGDGDPVTPIPRIIAVSAGHEHSLFLDTHGRVYACGNGRNGKLGLGDAYDRRLPVRIRGLPRISAISAGGQHSLVLSRTGAVFAFGKGDDGQLGTGDSQSYYRPVCVVDEPPMVAVSAGAKHSLCLDSSGCVYAYGCGGTGRLGLGDVQNRPWPESISSTCWMDTTGCINEARAIPRFSAISAGLEHSLLLDSVGRVFSMGNQASGKLGLGDEAHRFLPAQVMGLPKAFLVSAGHYHSLVLARGVDVEYYHRQYVEAAMRLVNEEQRRFARWQDETRRRVVYMQQHAAAVAMAQQQQQQQQKAQQQQAQGAYAQYSYRNPEPILRPPHHYGAQPNQAAYSYGAASQGGGPGLAGEGQYGRAYAQPQYRYQQYAPQYAPAVAGGAGGMAREGNMQVQGVQYASPAYVQTASAQPVVASAMAHSAASAQAEAQFRASQPAPVMGGVIMGRTGVGEDSAEQERGGARRVEGADLPSRPWT